MNMTMTNPAHPGRIIKTALEELEIPVAEAAEGLGVSRQQLHRVIAGTSGITPEMAVRLEQGIGSTAATWLKMQTDYDLAQVRRRAHEMHITRLAPKAAIA